MNKQELGIYTGLKSTGDYCRITDDGTKLYMIQWNQLLCFEGEGLNDMNGNELTAFIRRNIQDFEALLLSS
jgi:hypothetical protein